MVTHPTPKNERNARTSRKLFRKDFARTRTRATAHRMCACAHAPSQLIPYYVVVQLFDIHIWWFTCCFHTPLKNSQQLHTYMLLLLLSTTELCTPGLAAQVPARRGLKDKKPACCTEEAQDWENLEAIAECTCFPVCFVVPGMPGGIVWYSYPFKQANEQKQTNKLFSKDMWGSDHLKRETICIVIFLKRKISYTYISVDIPVVLLRPWKIVSSYIHTCFYCWSQLLSSVRLASARPQRRKTCLLYWGTELRNLEARAEFTVCTITEYIHSAPSN